jgi:hypothetical protein
VADLRPDDGLDGAGVVELRRPAVFALSERWELNRHGVATATATDARRRDAESISH